MSYALKKVVTEHFVDVLRQSHGRAQTGWLELHSTGYPQMQDPPVSASPGLGLQTFATLTGWRLYRFHYVRVTTIQNLECF